jgi:hypothetical protein
MSLAPLALLALSLAAAGCTNRTPPAGPPEVSTARTEPAATGFAEVATPEQVQTVRALLRARHVEDLPDRARLDSVGAAASALRTVAITDDLLVTRARALERLGLYDSEDVVAFLVQQAGAADVHPKLRAAAIEGLGHTDLTVRQEARDLLEGVVRGSDVRLALEAVEALRTLARSADLLKAIAADPTLAQPVRDAAGRGAPPESLIVP